MRRFAFLLAMSAMVALPGCASDDSSSLADDENLTGANDVFASTEALPFRLDAPFAKLFARYKARTPDSGTANATAQYSEKGTLTLGTKKLDVTVRVRGNTSADECTFLKYSVEFLDPQKTIGTPFQGHKKVRVNSHCGEHPASENVGEHQRILNERSPIREDLAYRMVRAAGMTTYVSRLAVVTYKDTGSSSAAAITRHALLLETGGDANRRFIAEKKVPATSHYLDGDRASDSPENPNLHVDGIAVADIVKVSLSATLLANVDWGFGGDDSDGPWNVDLFGDPNGSAVLAIPTDFDLSEVVLGISGRSQVEVMRQTTLSSKPALRKIAKGFFVKNKAAVKAAIDVAEREGIAAKRLPSTDGRHTTDEGFARARADFDAFYALPELKP